MDEATSPEYVRQIRGLVASSTTKQRSKPQRTQRYTERSFITGLCEPPCSLWFKTESDKAGKNVINPGSPDQIADRLGDSDRIQEALKQAARETILDHVRTGDRIVVWRDGKVAWEEPACDEPQKASDKEQT